MTQREMELQIKALEAKNAELTAKLTVKTTISFKVSEKGAVSVYGLGRFPVTLYAGQMERFLAEKDNLLKFINEHPELARK